MLTTEIWNNIQTVLLIASFAFVVIKFRGGEQQNLLGKTISDLVNTIQSLQKSLTDADERNKGMVMRYQRECEEQQREIDKLAKERDEAKDTAGRAKMHEHQGIQNLAGITRVSGLKDEKIKDLQRINSELQGINSELRVWKKRVDKWFTDHNINPETLEPKESL